jgi:hypothetical protein
MYIKSNFIPGELYEKFLIEFKDKPISIFNDYTPTLEELSINPINILVIMEPNQLFGLHNWAIQNAHLFSLILTWSEDILKHHNAILLPFGTSFLWDGQRYKKLAQKEKQFEVSFLCGIKNQIEGQQLRQKIFQKEDKVNIPKKWFYTVDGPKDICFENNMFHIAVENSQNKNYFTEKIVDCFLTKTIPIYWGCPNIDEFFHGEGIITFKDENELIEILNSLEQGDYEMRKKFIESNYELAIGWADYFKRIKDIINDVIQLNNI